MLAAVFGHDFTKAFNKVLIVCVRGCRCCLMVNARHVAALADDRFEALEFCVNGFRAVYDAQFVEVTDELDMRETLTDFYDVNARVDVDRQETVYTTRGKVRDQQSKVAVSVNEYVLDARALYPDCSLADFYDEVTMPPELRKAHQANDKAVMQAYGFWGKLNTQTACVAELMKMYLPLVK